MSSTDLRSLPGFRDFPPEELALRSHVFQAWRGAAERHGFQEYDGPPLEALELYTDKSGDEIVGQLYAFTDKGDREVALRPEMTPSLARILAARSRGMPKPIRWFTIPQLFRYERQQRGRLREHFQWNVDVVGEAGVAADAEVLAVALDGLRGLGLGPEHVRARVSDRRLLTAVLRASGVDDARMDAAYQVIDKIERTTPEALETRLADEVGLDAGAGRRLLERIGLSDPDALADAFADHPGVLEALEPVREYLQILAEMGYGDFVELDLAIVRGLAYYTGIVFELFDRAGELRAICGGGRYDRLLERVGGEPLPAVGFGMGDVVLGELLAEHDLVPEYGRAVDFFLVVIGEEQRAAALGLARRLRDAGRSVTYALRDTSVRKQFRSAETEGARQVVVLGPDEAARGVVVVRDMASGTEAEVDPESLT